MDQHTFTPSVRRVALPFPDCDILAAHPDDEVLSATALLLRSRRPRVIHLTDGAPADTAFWSPDARGSAEDYVRLRERETIAALAIAEIGRDRLTSLGATDLESIDAAVALASALAERLLAQRPEVLVTHAYEGGHPDHDTAALVARATVQLLRRRGAEPPTLWEMAGYHADGERLAFGSFLPPAGASIDIELSGVERARKRAMFACHVSQRRVLEQFPILREALRPAGRCDFSRPPHPGQLYYERLGFPVDGEAWRRRAQRALQQMNLAPCL